MQNKQPIHRAKLLRSLALLALLLGLCLAKIETSFADISCSPSKNYDANKLTSPAFTSFNTFLGQTNFLELGSSGEKNLELTISIYNYTGQLLSRFNTQSKAGLQKDLDINQIIRKACSQRPAACAELTDQDYDGIPDTIGLIKIEFDDSDATSPLLARLSTYLRDKRDLGNFAFALTRGVENPSRAVSSFVLVNTISPDGNDKPTENWLEINNTEKAQKVALEIFDKRGRLLLTPRLGLRKNETRHLEINALIGGTKQDVFLVKISPLGGGHSLTRLTRYGRNAESYTFAATEEAKLASGQSRLFFASADSTPSYREQNYLELANALSTNIRVFLKLSGKKGLLLESEFSLSPLSQLHLDVSALLKKFGETTGQLEVSSNRPASLVAQNMIYYQEPNSNELQAAHFSSQKRGVGFLLTSSSNSFLDTENRIRVSSIKDEESKFLISNKNLGLSSSGKFVTQNSSKSFSLSERQSTSLELSELGLLKKNSHGSLSLIFQAQNPLEDRAFGELLRVRKQPGTEKLDFVLPVRLEQRGMLSEPPCK